MGPLPSSPDMSSPNNPCLWKGIYLHRLCIRLTGFESWLFHLEVGLSCAFYLIFQSFICIRGKWQSLHCNSLLCSVIVRTEWENVKCLAQCLECQKYPTNARCDSWIMPGLPSESVLCHPDSLAHRLFLKITPFLWRPCLTPCGWETCHPKWSQCPVITSEAAYISLGQLWFSHFSDVWAPLMSSAVCVPRGSAESDTESGLADGQEEQAGTH